MDKLFESGDGEGFGPYMAAFKVNNRVIVHKL